MKLSIGIVGLPNVGKSTLFNALLQKQVAFAANYPFATIEPNVGIVEVPDERLAKLADVIAGDPSTSLRMNRPPIVPAAVQFYDIAGLVAGASKGEGLGNKFLSHIREVAAIVHVVRLFEDGDVIHVANKVDPISDIQTIETELILADLSTLEKQREPKPTASKEEKATYEVAKFVKEQLDKGISVRKIQLEDEQKAAIAPLQLLTAKPVLFVFNLSEQQLENSAESIKKIEHVLKTANGDDSEQIRMTENYIYLCAKLENEVVAFPKEEQKEYLAQYNLEETGLNRLINKAYELLGLISFLTAGEKEVRAWTIQNGASAPQAAGVIHTDFEKHFIKADIVPYPTFIEVGGWVKARELGKVQIVGKEYIMKDGEVVEFKVGI